MSNPLRRQVEAALTKHEVKVKKYVVAPYAVTYERDYSALLDDLCALLRPVVTKSDLVRTLNHYGVFGDVGGVSIQSPLVNALDRLLTGAEAEPTEWCQHWTRFHGQWVRRRVEPSSAGYGYYARSDWDICPVAGCHAPKPTSG